MTDYASLGLTFRPIDAWPGALRGVDERRRAPFSAPWSSTVDLLDRELFQLDACDVVLQIAIDESQIRIDGYPYARASATHPGVILAFHSLLHHVDLKYAVDTYWRWQDNLRAIALALEALRKVDRYGVTRRGEQYTGWKALPSGTPMPAQTGVLTVEEAARFLLDHDDNPLSAGMGPEALIGHAGRIKTVYLRAARRLHPDAGGDAQLFARLQEARRLLTDDAGVAV